MSRFRTPWPYFALIFAGQSILYAVAFAPDPVSASPLAALPLFPLLLQQRQFFQGVWFVQWGIHASEAVFSALALSLLSDPAREAGSRRVDMAVLPGVRVRLRRGARSEGFLFWFAQTFFGGFASLRLLLERVPPPSPEGVKVKSRSSLCLFACARFCDE
jgi:hypothetical protein